MSEITNLWENVNILWLICFAKKVFVYFTNNLRVPSNRVAIVSKNVFWGAKRPFRPGMVDPERKIEGLRNLSVILIYFHCLRRIQYSPVTLTIFPSRFLKGQFLCTMQQYLVLPIYQRVNKQRKLHTDYLARLDYLFDNRQRTWIFPPFFSILFANIFSAIHSYRKRGKFKIEYVAYFSCQCSGDIFSRRYIRINF